MPIRPANHRLWVIIYIAMNIAAVALWTAWYNRPAQQPDRTTTHETGQAPGEGRATGAFALAQRMAALVCSNAHAMEARPPFSLSLQTVHTASRLTSLAFPRFPTDWDDRDDALDSQGVCAVLFPDRSVYHCGETVTLSGLVRDDDRQSIPGMPLEISLITEEGRMVDQSEVWTDEAGRLNLTAVLADDAPIGFFLVEARLPGRTATVGETIVRVEPCPTNASDTAAEGK